MFLPEYEIGQYQRGHATRDNSVKAKWDHKPAEGKPAASFQGNSQGNSWMSIKPAAKLGKRQKWLLMG
jgi:hypothetical protein